MADWLTNSGRGIEALAGYLGVPGVHGFQAALCIFGGAICIWVGVAVPTAIRRTQLGGSPRKQRRRFIAAVETASE